MKNAIYVYIAAVSLALCGLAGIAAAQGSEGSTSITYDDSTGLVTVYGATTNDLDTSYATEVPLTVRDQNNVTVASGNDYELYGGSSVSLQFAATPGATYTATTQHCFRLQYSDYDGVYPYQLFYYDDWNMSSFTSENINSPLDYWFAAPGYPEIHRPTNFFCVGKTYDSVTIPPKITIDGPASVVDGTPVTFSLTVEGTTATGIYWQIIAPTGAGNSPQSYFIDQNELTTSTTAHWFALPNGACTASSSSTYQIKATVSHNGGEDTVEKDFTVTVPDTLGHVPPPSVGGYPTISYNSSAPFGERYYVSGVGLLERVTYAAEIYLPTSSQFYYKVSQHEAVHVQQFSSGIASSYYLIGDTTNANTFMYRIKDLTAFSEAALRDSIDLERVPFASSESLRLKADYPTQLEGDAYAVSDLIAPLYVSQSTCNKPL